MTDSLYFLFLDEIYDPNLNHFRHLVKDEIFTHEHHWHFGLCSIYLPASCLNRLYLRANQIKRKYYPKQNNLVFHYVDILNNARLFSDLAIRKDKKRAFTSSLNSFLSNTPFSYNCVFIDKHELIKKFGEWDSNKRIYKIKKVGSNLFPKSKAIDYNLYLLCLRQVIVDFCSFLQNKKVVARGIIVAEARGEREDTELRSAFQKIYYHGVGKFKPKEVRNIALDLLLVPKTQNYIGTQLADLVLYPTYDALVPQHSRRTDHVIDFEKVLKKKIKGKITVIPS